MFRRARGRDTGEAQPLRFPPLEDEPERLGCFVGADAAVPGGLQRSWCLCLAESCADHNSVRSIRPFDVGLFGSASADLPSCRHHRGRIGPPVGHGICGVGGCAGQRWALRAPASRSGVRRVRVGAPGRHRTRGHGGAVGCDGSCAARLHRERRVRRVGGDARPAGGARVLRRTPRSAGLDRRLLLTGSPGRVHHRSCRRPHPRPDQQAGRRFERRGRCHPRDCRHPGQSR